MFTSNVDDLSIDDDILNLIDEVDIDEFLKEAAKVIEDADRLTDFVREKSTIAIERFLVSSSIMYPPIISLLRLIPPRMHY